MILLKWLIKVLMFDESQIEALVELGFTRAEAIQELNLELNELFDVL